MDSISYVYISWTINGMWMIYVTCEKGSPKFSNIIARALAYHTAVQQCQLRAKWLLWSTRFLHVSEENVRRIQESFKHSPRKWTCRASRELGIPQLTVRHVLRRRLLFNWVHLFESPCIIKFWDHHRMHSPSLTEMSSCGSWLHCKPSLPQLRI